MKMILVILIKLVLYDNFCDRRTDPKNIMRINTITEQHSWVQPSDKKSTLCKTAQMHRLRNSTAGHQKFRLVVAKNIKYHPLPGWRGGPALCLPCQVFCSGWYSTVRTCECIIIMVMVLVNVIITIIIIIILVTTGGSTLVFNRSERSKSSRHGWPTIHCCWQVSSSSSPSPT